MPNLDARTVDDFGRQWAQFDHHEVDDEEIARRAAQYFRDFPWDALPADPRGFDAGCGSGRWARFAATRAGYLLCVDASAEALQVARHNLEHLDNCEFAVGTLEEMPCPDDSMDFGYSLGVIHHVPDPVSATRALVEKLKIGGYLLIYFYYALDNRPAWYRQLWRAVNRVRPAIARFPPPLKYAASQVIAAGVYWPLARGARVAERLGVDVSNAPLSAYRDKSYYVMRTDAHDRFNPQIELRYTREQLTELMSGAGLDDIHFAEGPPFWVAHGVRRR